MIKKHRRMHQLNKNSQMLATKLQKLKLRLTHLQHQSPISTVLPINVILCSEVWAIKPFQSLVQHMRLGSRRVERTSVTTIKHTDQLPLHTREHSQHITVSTLQSHSVLFNNVHIYLTLKFHSAQPK